MKTRFEEIVDVEAVGGENTKKMNDLLALAGLEDIPPSYADTEKILFIGIDFQNDFMENGALGVPHSHKDIANVTRFIYNHLEKITAIAVSLDTHHLQQIFHPSWWVDENGENPKPYTIITAKDVEDGKWTAVEKQEESLEYVQNLEKLGKKQLCIWTYHCIEGTVGAALEGQFSNIIHFHSLVRKSKIDKIIKGRDPLSEMYGIIKPEYDKLNYCNNQFLETIRLYDKIIFAGEAKSHCVLESVKQIVEYYADEKNITSRIYLLEDCMSSIPGFELTTEETFLSFEEQYQVNIVKSTDLSLR
ncbi:hypothetical protein [Aneurinibacillus tyrosinisolvens]|uniref:hypothetical protein n=1 Tax=Aneurinibacillus tyrosinisolvens TaxID=1443435 RepID=UPI00063F3765|nr:hypothetical protein [Aneurinibacillus tyrosinisolvens]